MLVVEVDDVDAEPFQARLARLGNILRPAVDAVDRTITLDLAELGRQHHAVATAPDRVPDHLLVMAPAVHVGAVEVVDATVDRLSDQRLGLGIVGGAVDARQRHAAESDRRDRKTLRAQIAMRDPRHDARCLVTARGDDSMNIACRNRAAITARAE